MFSSQISPLVHFLRHLIAFWILLNCPILVTISINLQFCCDATATRGRESETGSNLCSSLELQSKTHFTSIQYSFDAKLTNTTKLKSTEKVNADMKWIELISRKSILCELGRRWQGKWDRERIGQNWVKFGEILFSYFLPSLFLSHLTLNGQFHYSKNRNRNWKWIDRERERAKEAKQTKWRTVYETSQMPMLVVLLLLLLLMMLLGRYQINYFLPLRFAFLLDFLVFGIPLYYMGIADIFRPTMETENQKIFFETDVCVRCAMCVCVCC